MHTDFILQRKIIFKKNNRWIGWYLNAEVVTRLLRCKQIVGVCCLKQPSPPFHMTIISTTWIHLCIITVTGTTIYYITSKVLLLWLLHQPLICSPSKSFHIAYESVIIPSNFCFILALSCWSCLLVEQRRKYITDQHQIRKLTEHHKHFVSLIV